MRQKLLEKGPVARRSILLALVVGVPLFFIRTVHDPINVPKLGLLAAGVAVVAAIRIAELLQGSSPEGLKHVWVPAACFAVPLSIAWLLSSYRGYELIGKYGRFQGLVPYLLVIALGVLLADAFEGRALTLAWGFVTAGALMGAYSLVQALHADPFEWNLFGAITHEAVSTTGNPNFTGGFLGIVLPVAIGVYLVDKPRRKRSRWLVVFIAGGWIVAQSQGGWGAGVAGMLVLAGFLAQPRWKHARVAGVAFALLIAVAAIGVSLLGYFQPTLAHIPYTATLRGNWWVGAVHMAAHSPIFGRGPDAFSFLGVLHRTPFDAQAIGYAFADSPHSVPMAFLANAGLLGLLGFVGAVVWTIRRGLSLPVENILGAAFFGSALAYFVQSVVSIDEITLRVAAWAALAGIPAAATTVMQTKKSHAAQVKKGKPKRVAIQRPQPLAWWPVIALLVVGALVALWWSGSFVIADYRVAQADAHFSGAPASSTTEFHRALGFRDDFNYRQTFATDAANAALAMKENGAPYLHDAESAMSYVYRFPDLNGTVLLAGIEHAWARTDPAADQKALDLYRRAIGLDPYDPLPRQAAAEVYLDARDYSGALAVLRPVQDATKPAQYPQYWGTLALVEARLGDGAAAKAAALKTLVVDPTNQEAQQAQQLVGG